MQGEEINSENMLKVVEVVKENLVGIIGVSNEEVKLEIERNNKKEELKQNDDDIIEVKNYNVIDEEDLIEGE